MTKHLTRDQRLQIHTLKNFGATPEEIQKATGFKLTRISRISKLPVTPKSGRGQHKAITSPIKGRIIDILNSGAEARRMPYKELASTLQLNLSEATIRKSLAQISYHRRIARPKPWLSILPLHYALS